ncbi:cytochrome P450 [Streptomyces canus]|uniref:cytochrome P450 n=1 Tax=Streptomyces sp. SAI-144 TaxID=2940544 RepID=UPI0024750174|nr:cytochrome P450 [Streptomyces sp. SAI-144]MDH6435680.1 cytochrome P450 [Streptomyces sp. SAI-144]
MDNPITWYDRIREEHRVLWHPETSSWYVTRFDDVWDLLVSPDLGARAKDTFTKKMTPEQREICSPLIDFISSWPVFSDTPRHTDIHRLLLPAFTQPEVERVIRAVREYVDGGFTTAEWNSEELLDLIVRPACKVALAQFLGMELAEFDKVPLWSRRIIAFAGQTEFNRQVMDEATEALAEFTEFVLSTAGRRRSALSAQLSQAADRGEISDADIVAIYAQMVTGFLQPTMSSLAAAVEALTRSEEYSEYFAQDPDTFISESLRLASPFHFAPRRTLTDIRVGEHVIPADERIVLLLVSANRDPRRFSDPLSFRMDRGRPPHVSFARGRYACLGASMAKQLMTTVLTAILDSRFGPLPALRVDWNVGRGMRMAERLVPAEL